MKARQAAVLGLAVLLASSCSEVESIPTAPDRAAPRPAAPSDGPSEAISATSQSPPSTVPEAYQHYTSLDVSVDVGWLDTHTAYGTTVVKFGGNNATATMDLQVRSASGSILGSNTASAQISWIFPGDSALRVTTRVYVSQTCGAIAQGTGVGTVWDSFISANQSLMSWGKKVDTETGSAGQPACPVIIPPTNNPPAGGGDGSIPPPTPPPYYDPTAPQGPTGYWKCTVWYVGYDYVADHCEWVWVTSYDKTPLSRPLLSRLESPARASTFAGADAPSVFVIVSDQVPAGALAVIERHRQGPFRNVLLVPSSTVRPAVFAAVMRALSDSRARHGETPDRDRQLVLSGNVQDDQVPASSRDYASSFTALIASAKRADAGAYGMRPMLEIRLGR